MNDYMFFNTLRLHQSVKCLGWCQFCRNRLNRGRDSLCEFQYYASLACKCLFTPLFEIFLGKP